MWKCSIHITTYLYYTHFSEKIPDYFSAAGAPCNSHMIDLIRLHDVQSQFWWFRSMESEVLIHHHSSYHRAVLHLWIKDKWAVWCLCQEYGKWKLYRRTGTFVHEWVAFETGLLEKLWKDRNFIKNPLYWKEVASAELAVVTDDSYSGFFIWDDCENGKLELSQWMKRAVLAG